LWSQAQNPARTRQKTAERSKGKEKKVASFYSQKKASCEIYHRSLWCTKVGFRSRL